MEHTTPITFPEDETFDIGQDTRTPLAFIEYRYDVPFKFTGKINKLTFNLEPEAGHESGSQVTSKGRRAMGMKKLLGLAAVLEAATGLALVIQPCARSPSCCLATALPGRGWRWHLL